MANIPLMTFGVCIRRARKAQGKTLRKLAGDLNISHVHLVHLEKGVKSPSDAIILALAKELGEDSDWLFALAGRLTSDVQDLVSRRPKKYKALLRQLRKASDEVREVKDGKW